MTALETHIAEIEAMSAADRKAQWRKMFGTPAPPAFGSGLLARALAHRLQEQAMGGLSKRDMRRITSLGTSGDKVGKKPKDAHALRPGTWLSRTWHGEVHQVVVLENGFEYGGECYASLSAIARKITGANWSGPRFFGLHSPRLGKLGVTTHG